MSRVCASVVVMCALVVPSASQAATTVGSSLRARADLFVRCNTECSSVQDARPGGAGLVIPEDGVITRWRVRAATLGTIRLRILRREEDGGYSSVAIGPEVKLDRTHGPGQDVLYEFPARIPVQAGDTIGLDRDGKAGGIFHSYGTNTSYAVADYGPRLADDANDVQPTLVSPGRELLLNVGVEKDSDGDGFGDETQDNCPTIPNDQTDKPCTTPTPAPTQTPTGPTSTPVDNTTPQHQQGSEGPPVAGERERATGVRRHQRRGPARARPPRPADPQRVHSRTRQPRAKPPRPTGPDNSTHGQAPTPRPKPPSSNAPAPGGHDNAPKPRSKPVAHHQPTQQHNASPSPRPKPPASQPQGAQPHDQYGSPRPAPKPKAHKPTRRHRKHTSRPAPPPAQGAPGWQPH